MPEVKDITELKKNLAAVGEARRKALGIKRTDQSSAISEKIAELAGKGGAIVEWTIRPQDSAESVGVACFCGCGCSCIA